MAPECSQIAPFGESFGPINNALRHLGIMTFGQRDEFEIVGLHRFRDFWDLFEDYEDSRRQADLNQERSSDIEMETRQPAPLRKPKPWWQFW